MMYSKNQLKTILKMKQQIFAEERLAYFAPAIDIVEVAAERGFAESNEDPFLTEIPWYEDPKNAWE